MNDKQQGGTKRRRYRLILIAVAAVILYAIAVQVTRVNLEEPLEPRRQENLVGLLRMLARPDFFTYRSDTRSTNLSIRMPCPEEVKASQVTAEGRIVIMTPNCATTTQDIVAISGEGFADEIQGIVRWYAAGATTTRLLTEFRTDNAGSFDATFTMPDIRETEEPQRIEIVEVLDRDITGLSPITQETLNRILETILMALMASTLGTLLAIPISFLGARNLMSNIGMPLAAIMAAIIAAPIGAGIGGFFASLLVNISESIVEENRFLALIIFLVSAALIWPVLRLGPPLLETEKRSPAQRLVSLARILVAVLLGIFALSILAQIGIIVGEWLSVHLSFFTFLGIDFFGFIGSFTKVVSGLIAILLALSVAFTLALIAASYANRFGQEVLLSSSEGSARLATVLLTIVGTTMLIFGLLYLVDWICLLGLCRQLPEETGELLIALAIPSLIGGLIAGLFSLRANPKRQLPVGMATYTITRTTLNVMRAIEPVLLGFVFVVWVGIGPFAGVLALIISSIADLGKLFSEQVENIDEGPVEAVTATGAGGIQTVVYAVIPQVVPHYTAFIFYRWDINVRLSTIIGFVGGGGIGLILFRATNLTQYSQAAVMVIAIAVVVTVLDMISSRIRKRII